MSKTVPLIDLFPEKYNIPHYQRGYRWEAQEVCELLDDLWNFCKDKENGDFYCLQPIVLQRNTNGDYDVLDGQQRLTTLYLLLVFLEEKRYDDGYKQSLFTLNYETRIECKDFLKEKKFKGELDSSNIDFHHICKAYATITKWFEDPNHRGAKAKLVPILMDNNEKGNRNVRFIHYEVEKDTNPIDVFIRLNVGKIPLTDAELTKALLLQSDKYEARELEFLKMRLFQIASEWDKIEYMLQNEEFWYFLCNNTNEKPTHIEFIFDLIADKIQKEKKYFDTKPTKHATFLILDKYLKKLMEEEKLSRIESVDKIWQQVTAYFEYFKDWFDDRELFHFIGYLIAVKGNQMIDTLILQSKKLSKTAFKTHLQVEIAKTIIINKKRKDKNGKEFQVQFDDLSYENEEQQSDYKAEIHKILLLHNVHTTLKSAKEKARFPFNLYKQTKKNEKWSLEHIHAQNSEDITKRENQISWLNDHINSLSKQNNEGFKELIVEMETLKNAETIDKDAFNALVKKVYEAVNKLSGTTQKEGHTISNLCLVDARTNSKLNNSVFDVKREIIKKQELDGFYIPICTRNVFLKAYSEYPLNNAYWTADDRKGYLESVRNTYDFFVNSNNKNS